MDHINPVVFV